MQKKKKKKNPFIRKPTPIPKEYNPYEDICRIMPHYVASNYQYFELLTTPRLNILDGDAYVLRIKEKISCLKRELLL